MTNFFKPNSEKFILFIEIFFIRLVIETLKKIDGERKCFRMIGGVLVERTVKDVLPALMHNSEQVFHYIVIRTLNEFLTALLKVLSCFKQIFTDIKSN